MKKILFSLLLNLLVQIPIKAQSYYYGSVSSFGEYNMRGKTYVIMPASNEVNANDVEFKEYSSYVKKILAIEGAHETVDSTDADLCIFMDYGISDNSYERIVSVSTGSSPITTYSTNTSNTTYTYGVSGYRNVQQHVEKHKRAICLSACENQKGSPIVWKTEIKSSGSNSKLREVLPIMIYCAINKLGVDNEEDWSISDADKNLKIFKKLKINNNTYMSPTIDYCSGNKISIVAIERNPNETIVYFYKGKNSEQASVSPKMYIEFEGHKIYPIDAENITLGRPIRNSRFFSVKYPAIPKDVVSINISEEDIEIKDVSKKKIWKGIQLVK